jgi:hypothetical protein
MHLPRDHLLDDLATFYVEVVAAAAGAAIAASRSDDGVCGTLRHVVKASKRESQGSKCVSSGFSVEFQIKGTTAATVGKDYVAYDLGARNYDLIVTRATIATPVYLFLVCFGAEHWVAVEKEELILRASAYWWRRSGVPANNGPTVRIEIPVVSRLTPNALRYMLEGAKNKHLQ